MKTNRSSVIQFPRKGCFLHNSIFVFIDLQLEYVSSGRAYALEDTENCLSNSLKILAMAREYGMAIAHFRRIMDGAFFNQATAFSNWIEDFQPYPNEMVFEREKPSIYSNSAFTAFIDEIDSPELIVVGLTGEKSCLSTAIESAHHNYKLTFINDASATQKIGNYTEKQSHDFVTKIINMYADITTTEKMLSSMEHDYINNENRYEI